MPTPAAIAPTAIAPVVHAPIGAAPVAALAPPRPKKRWWLRILITLFALGALAALLVVGLVVAIGVWGLEAFMSLPSAERPAAGIVDGASVQTCEAAARCCEAAGGSSCQSYRTPPLDVADCRLGIGAFGDALASRGEDAAMCAPGYDGP